MLRAEMAWAGNHCVAALMASCMQNYSPRLTANATRALLLGHYSAIFDTESYLVIKTG